MRDAKIVTNLYEWMLDENVERLLTVNGFSLNGSAYDKFARLCICVERDPSHPFSRYLQSTLEACFSVSLPMSAKTCGQIWRLTAERMLLEPCDEGRQAEKPHFEILPPRDSEAIQNSFFDINGLQIQAESWQEWKTAAEAELLSAIKADQRPSVSFPSDFVFEKPNLYRVERHLSGNAENHSLWCAQMLYFAVSFCYRRGLRCRVNWTGNCGQLVELLQYVSKLTPISDLLLQCGEASDATLQAVCRLVSTSRTKRNEGTPPVLLIL